MLMTESGIETLHAVGTGGGDGWMRGPCACPRAKAIRFLYATSPNRVATRTGTRPPPILTSTPCPYSMKAMFLRFLDSVGKDHQRTMRAAQGLHGAFAAYVWNHRHNHGDDE